MTKNATTGKATPGKSATLTIAGNDDKPHDRLTAELVAAGTAGNAFTITMYAKGTFGELSLTDCVAVLHDAAKAVNGGDLSTAEAVLAAQASSLNAIFGELARRAAMNMGEYLDATDRYLRLALKAQAQCRATLETLAAIRNPPVVFARQANIAHGPQQVNNGSAEAARLSREVRAGAGDMEPEQTGLLERQHGERLDTRTASKASGVDSHLETVGALDRAAQS